MPAELKQRLNRYFANRSTDPDSTTPDMGAISYYQLNYVNTPTNVTITTNSSGNTILNWDESEGAIFYNIYYGTTPFSITDTLSICVRALTYTDTIPTNRKFYIVKGKNNRISQRYFTTKTNITNKKSDVH